MLVLGLLLIIGASLITVGAIYDAGEEATVEILGQTLTTTAAGVFVAGAVTMLMFLVGVWALMSSMGRAKRKRAERKQAKARHRDSVSRLEEERTALRAENERLAEELADRRSAAGGTTAGGAAAGAAGGAAAGGAATHEHSDHDNPGTDHANPGTHEERGGARGLLDRMTGRHDHGTYDTSDTTPTDSRTVHDTSAAPDADGHRSERVIDHNTDLASRETTSTARHREL